MNPTPSRPLRKHLSHSRALYCVIVNQCATPGLGSIMARRYVAGCGQLLVALIGFAMVTVWLIQYYFVKISRLIDDLPVDENVNWRVFAIGWLIFGIAWVWSWFTSISVLREAKRTAEPELKTPPRLK